MPDTPAQLEQQNEALTRQLLEWIASDRRTYAQALETWRSSCPRHSIWEDALAAGLIDCGRGRDGDLRLTAEGRRRLEARG